MMEAGIAHLIQCASLTERVRKSDLAAANMQRTSNEILRVESRGSAMPIGNRLVTSRLLRFR